MSAAPNLPRLRTFITSFAAEIEAGADETQLLERGAALLRQLILVDDWLPDSFSQPDPQHYRQYLLHCDSAERFSVVSFVWGPGQATPIHDHGVWGLVGILRGAELVQGYKKDEDGELGMAGDPHILSAGEVEAIAPGAGDIHRVANAHDDRVSVSIHVYGANIGRVERATYDGAGQAKRFVSGYANRELPNIWDQPTS